MIVVERTAPRTALLLVNLGTPRSPRTADVRAYLREFLGDPRVLDIGPVARWLLLNLLILPFRPRRSAEAYRKIWTERGSPLLLHGEELTAKVRERLGARVDVALAMRYGRPAIGDAVGRLVRGGVERLVVFPLYPQCSSAATGSTIEEVFRCAARAWNVPHVHVVPPFFDHPAFIEVFAGLMRPHLERVAPERVYFSFHGLPERQVKKSDVGGTHCLQADDCCATTVANRHCYRAQCYATARRLAERLALPEERVVVCFQSRLGREPWIRPYTDVEIARDARDGIRRAVIASPAFVADCLETLEELGLRAVESWKANGGEILDVVPCPNASDAWADAVVAIARGGTNWLDAG